MFISKHYGAIIVFTDQFNMILYTHDEHDINFTLQLSYKLTMNQKKLAKKIGVSEPWLSLVLSLKVSASVELIDRISRETGIPRRTLMVGPVETIKSRMERYFKRVRLEELKKRDMRARQ